MALYIYQGKKIDGSIIKGKTEVENEEEARILLRNKGIYATSIKEENGTNNLSINFDKKIQYKDLAIFCRQMYFSLNAGITMLRALDMVKEQVENKRLKRILRKTYEDVQKGLSLSEALEKHKEIPYMFCATIRVGESTGAIDEIMGDMSDYYDKQHRQRKKINNALTYPKFLMAFSVLIVLGLVIFVVPTFVEGILSAGETVPLPTQIIISISYFIKQNGILLGMFIIVLLLIKRVFIDKNEIIQFNIDKFLVKDKYIAAISQQIFTSRFARTFGLLVNSGMNVIESLEITGNAVNNRYIKHELELCKRDINSGKSIGDALESRKVFPVMLTQMMKIGEETGSLDNVLKKTSEYYEIEAEFAIEKLTSLVEPAMIIFLAIIVGFVVVSLALPMFQIMGATG